MKQVKLTVLTGPPLCGKTTHARLLTEKFGGIHISSGAIAKALMDDKTRKAYSNGMLSPHGVHITNAIHDTIMANIHLPIFLDGFPRTLDQLEELEWWWHKLNQRTAGGGKMLMVHLNTPAMVVMDRLKLRKRDEFDTEQITAMRYETYRSVTLPLLSSLRADSWISTRFTFTGDILPERVQPLIESTVNAYLRPEEHLRDAH